jgi:CHAT domain-containing protein/Tfp pilus assembly protein PilF
MCRQQRLVIGLWIAASCANASAAAREPRVLAPGRAVEATLDAGAAPHVYEFPAQAGEFLQVLIDQSSLMFDARLLAPDRSELAVVSNSDGDDEARSLLAIAGAAGTYRIQIGRFLSDSSGGSYRVALAAARAALPDDAKRVEADRRYREGGRLRFQATADSFKQAIAQYDAALGLWRELGDRRNEALTLLQAGGARYLLGDSRAALDVFEQSLTMWRALGNSSKVAGALSNAAVCLNNLGEPARALAYYAEALPLLQSAGQRASEANTLSNIGRVHSVLGEHQQALEYFERALPIWARLDDSRQPNTLANIGLEHWTLGQPSLARIYLEQALALFRKRSDNNGVALALNNLGLVLKPAEPMRAREAFEQALTLRRAGGDRRAEAAVLQNLGASYADEGRHDRARDYFAQALALRRTTGDRTGEASTLAQLGASYVDGGDARSALAPLTESLQIASAIGNQEVAATVRYQLARVDRADGRLSDALNRVNAALTWSESVRAGLLSPDVRATYFATVRYQYDLLVDLLMRLHRQQPDAGFDARALEASERARARSMLDLLAEAQVDIRQDVDPALRERELQASAVLTTKTERRMRLASGPANPTEVAAADREIGVAAAELRAVEDTLRTRSPRYAALTHPPPLSIADIQDALDDRSALLEYSLGADRSVLWVVTRGSLTSYDLPPRAEVERVARRAYQALTMVGSTASPSALRALSDMVLAPALPQVATRRLLVIADGALQYVPFAALPAGHGTPLALAHEIVSLPSASTLVLLRRETAGRLEAPESVAILADPVFDGKDSRVAGGMPAPRSNPNDEDDSLERSAHDFELRGFDRLASTRSEAETIAALGGAGHVLKAVDFDASIATVKSGQLERYRIVHFATHGLVNNQHPGLSGLVLSLVDKQGRPMRGFLQAHEIYNLRLGADLVVLSACQTALGADVRGEGLIGLTRAFMYAGAPRVVSSLWSVSDRATAALMKAFYRRMLIDRMSVAAALRGAQLELRRNPRWSHPYYWAGFVVQGDPQ